MNIRFSKSVVVIAILSTTIISYAYGNDSMVGQPSVSTKDQSATATQYPSKTVNGIVFSVKSLRIGSPQENCGSLAVYIDITNTNNEPITLYFNFNKGSNILVNEYGTSWNGMFSRSSGVGLFSGGTGSDGSVLQKNVTQTAMIGGAADTCSVTNYGNSFNFQGEFLSFRDRGDGRLIQTGIYPVSFINLHRSSIADNTSQDLNSAGQQVKGLFKQIFGN